MCGICGFTQIVDDTLLWQMVQTLSHRGPDDSGIWSDNDVSLGHSRLSIIDLSPRGKQPLSNEEGDIWITYNGEVYNFLDLKENLNNHTFCSHTDTEVIIHAYEEYGLSFLEKLRGMYAFALYDSRKKKVILARDSIGKKPLYYYWNGETLIFASEIKAILPAFRKLGIKVNVDPIGLSSYLKNQYVAHDYTLLENIKKLPAGHYLVLDLKNKTIIIKSYWSIKENIRPGTESAIISQLLENLEESVKIRLISDVPIGSFLSGGIDSSAITAIANKYIDYDFHTFTANFSPFFSESSYAKQVADHLNTNHHEICIDPQMALKNFDTITKFFDEPIGDAAIIANFFLSKEAKKYVKVILTGEGSDEIFGGYNSYKLGLKYYPYYRLPGITRSLLNRGISIFKLSGNPFYNKWCIYIKFLCQESFENAYQYTWRMSGISDEELEWLGRHRNKTNERTLLRMPVGMTYPLNQMLAIDCLNHLPDCYLMKADKATMANSIETRAPFLDTNMINFAFSIPPNLKIKHNNEKYILKKALKLFLPDTITNRKKQGFGVPYREWMRNEFHEVADQTISDGELTNKIFMKEKINHLLSHYTTSKSLRPSLLVWNLFALERWHHLLKTESI